MEAVMKRLVIGLAFFLTLVTLHACGGGGGSDGGTSTDNSYSVYVSTY
jgi:hypothetical protein